jgi:Protein of unknown function (DUF2917)
MDGRDWEIDVREIRTLELGQSDAPECWFIDRPHTLTVCHGMLWVTVEGEPDDRWLRAGESMELSPHSTAWISSPESNSRFVLASESVPVLRVSRRFDWYRMWARTGRGRYQAP